MKFWSFLIATCFALSGCWPEPYEDDEIRVTILKPLPTKPQKARKAQNTKPQMVQKNSTIQSPPPANIVQLPNNPTGVFSAIISALQNAPSLSIDIEQTQMVDRQKNSQRSPEKNSTALKVENSEENQSSSPENSLQQQSAQIANIIVARQYNRTATEMPDNRTAPQAPTKKAKSRAAAKNKKPPPRVINFPQTEGGATSQTKARRMTLRELTANLVTYATYHRNPPGNTLYNRSENLSRSRKNKRNSNLKSCAKMGTKTAAQLAFLKAGGPIQDPYNLDPDGDGYACGWDPQRLRFDDIQ